MMRFSVASVLQVALVNKVLVLYFARELIPLLHLKISHINYKLAECSVARILMSNVTD